MKSWCFMSNRTVKPLDGVSSSILTDPKDYARFGIDPTDKRAECPDCKRRIKAIPVFAGFGDFVYHYARHKDTG